MRSHRRYARHAGRPARFRPAIGRVVFARLRRFFGRHRLGYWLLAAVLATAAGLAVARAQSRADRAAESWGRPVTVWVTDAPVGAGATLDADDLRRVEAPRHLWPEGAVQTNPAGRIARSDIGLGEIVVDHRLLGGTGAVPAGHRGIGLALGPATPPLAVGDRVDVVGLVTTGNEVVGRSGRVLTTNAVVVSVDDQRAVIAVAQADAERVASAVSTGEVVVTLR